MTHPAAAAIDGALGRARHLFLQFDGPVCDLHANQPQTAAADRLRAVLTAHDVQIPAAIADTSDPLDVLAYAADINRDLGAEADAELTRYETSAAATAIPAGYVHDTIASARESGRTVTIISTCSAQAMHAHLAPNSLDHQVEGVIGRDSYLPSPAAEHDLLHRTVDTLGIDPAACALIGQTTALLQAAIDHRIAAIAYAPNPAHDPAAGQAAISSLATVVLILRARPLPN